MSIPTIMRLSEKIPLTISDQHNGIFTSFVDPIWSEDFNAEMLDEIFIDEYGDRFVGRFLRKYSTGALTAVQTSAVASAIYSIYKEQWEHLYNANTSEYNPIENYRSTETEHRASEGVDESVGQSSRTTESDTSSDVYGFNDSTPTPQSKQDAAGSESLETGQSVEKAAQEDRELQRYGNIGVTTSAQMIQGEIDVWKWNYIKSVMHDIARFLCLSVY